MLTVKEMIKKCELWDFKVMAGEDGLNSVISYVTVLDAPDPSQWAKGGEFVITTGYCVKDDPQIFERVIEDLKATGAAAIGIKTDRFLHNIPDNVIEKANNLNFPIIHIPNHYAFTEIISPILTKIINDQADRLKKSEIIHKSFTQMVIDGGDIKDGVMLAKESYTEAFRVVQINRLSKITNNYKFYDEAGLYRLYYDISSTGYGKEFCRENLDKLIEYDKTNRTYLLDTLSCLNEIYSFRKDT